jgi:methylisocitrate lyase
MPDIGLLGLEEVAQQVRYISGVVEFPLLVDADTGFGGEPQVVRAVNELEKAGACAVQIEDQVSLKKCGHLEGKSLINSDEMVGKIRAACHARKNKDFLIVARTDARGVFDLEEAICRAQLYVKAGADVIFPEALHSRDEFKDFAKAVRAPLLANMTEFGKTPYLSAKEFQALGYRLVIFPMTIFRVTMKAAEDSLRELKKLGTQKSFLSKMQTRKELYDLLNYQVPDKVYGH